MLKLRMMKRLLIIFCLLFAIVSFQSSAIAEPVSEASIRNALERFPVAYQDRDDSYKSTQLDTIAHAISEATKVAKWNDNDRVSVAAFLITIGWHESRFLIRVHEGERKRFSYGLFQIHPASHGVTRADVVGLTRAETTRAAVVAASVLSKSWTCGGTPAGWFTAYYGGVPCGKDWKTLKARVNTFYWVRAYLVKENK
jgi:hypothetical protein